MPGKSTNYSLWLVLDDVSCRRFQTAIGNFAQRFSAPVFLPHVTLYSGIRSKDETAVIAQCREIAHCLPPVELHMETVGMENDRFRCLYVRVRNTPELAALFRRAEMLFRGNHDWYPHISLLYGVVHRSEKEKALREHYRTPLNRAEAIALALCDTSGDVEEWREVVRLPFRAKEQAFQL